MRKMLAAALAGAMVLSMASMTAFAAVTSHTTLEGELVTGGMMVDDKGVALNTHNTDVLYVNNDAYILLKNVDILSGSGGAFTGTADEIGTVMKQGNLNDWSLKVKKNEGTKIIDKVTLVEKSIGGTREPMIKITFKPEFTDKEHKVDLELTLTNKTDKELDVTTVTGSGDSATGDQLKDEGKILLSTKFYVGNSTDNDGDESYKAGDAGVVVKPLKNEDNEVIWENESKELAKLTFFADSDVAKYFPKLNTKWDNQAYLEYFNDQDAYLFEFVANPQISSTSRATLELYNPYINEDEEETVDPAEVIIYQIIDGLPVDVTSQFSYDENEDGDMTFSTKTRVLGSYIFAEKPYEELPEVEETPEAPADEAPVDASKKPANTGRY